MIRAASTYDARPKAGTPLPPHPKPKWIETGTSELVLFVGEAAQRLGMRRAELEGLVTPGKVQTLPLGYGYVIPTREVKQLMATRPPSV